MEGSVIEALPNAIWRIRTDDGAMLQATQSASLRRINVKVIPGDRVIVEVSPYDPHRGRIIQKKS